MKTLTCDKDHREGALERCHITRLLEYRKALSTVPLDLAPFGSEIKNMECKSVLIVEDDKSIRQMMKDVLEIEGYSVTTAKDGREGIEMLRALSPSPCLVLLDLMMPGTNGWKFLDFQRGDPSLSHIPVIVCSAYHESAKSIRPQAIIEKPVSLEALLNAVHTLCA